MNYLKNYLLILISVICIIPFSGCTKKSFDPTTKSREDFIGTWQGSVSTFKNNKFVKEYGTIVMYPDETGNALSGIFFLKANSIFHEFQFVNGTLYFKVVNSDPANLLCQNWNLGGYAIFTSENTIEVNISGNECGQVGEEYIEWSGSVLKTVVASDSVEYYNFGKNGNTWTYQVTLWDGSSCQVERKIDQVSSGYLFSGPVSQTCNWTGQNLTFKWEVAPDNFSNVNDTLLSNRPFSLPINAKPGVVYSTYVKHDTITLTLLDTNLLISTPAGSFKCAVFRYSEPVYPNKFKVNRISYFWINNLAGIVRHRVENPVYVTDVSVEELISKNF